MKICRGHRSGALALVFGVYLGAALATAEVVTEPRLAGVDGGSASPADGLPPDAPVVISPADGSQHPTEAPTLRVHVTDPDGDAMNVTFFGRELGDFAEDELSDQT